MKSTEHVLLDRIWSQEFWDEEAERIEIAYWNLIKDKIPNTPPPQGLSPTEHRFESFIRKLARKHKIGNLHVGLTSSDLEDNIRAKRIEESYIILSKQLKSFYASLLEKLNDKPLIAYTHLMPAGVTSIRRRMMPQIEASIMFPEVPKTMYKGIRGALGDCKIQDEIGVNKGELDGVFKEYFYTNVNQTTPHVSESYMAYWLCFQASLLVKIANDYRQMFALGQAYHTHNDIGSTAIAGKRPNPWELERASSMLEILYDLPSKIARVTGSCLLERTLTNQSVLNYVFKDSFLIMSNAINDMDNAIHKIMIVDQSKECMKKKYHTEEEALGLIKKGIPREKAHNIIRNKYNR